MKSIKVNFKNESNYEVVVKWLRDNGIEVIELNNAMPTLVSESTNNNVISGVTATKEKNDKKFPKLEDTNVFTLGKYVTVYPTLKSVRYWEREDFTPDKVRYGIKASLKDAGAEWNDKDKCFTFKTAKSLHEWVKAQKEREDARK